jgi:hypothetical protein
MLQSKDLGEVELLESYIEPGFVVRGANLVIYTLSEALKISNRHFQRFTGAVILPFDVDRIAFCRLGVILHVL